MLQSLTVALALPGKQSHTNEEPGSLRGLALQTIDAVAPFSIVAVCTAQLLEGIAPGSNGVVVALRSIDPSGTASPVTSRREFDQASPTTGARGPGSRLAPRLAGWSTDPPDEPLRHFMPSAIE
jgi:hypothetical protein